MRNPTRITAYNPENRDEFEQKGTKDTKRTPCNSKPVHLWGEAIRGAFFYGSALLCVLCALLFNFPFSCLGSRAASICDFSGDPKRWLLEGLPHASPDMAAWLP
jgi:hypothetical protein